MTDPALVSIEELRVDFETSEGMVVGVEDVSFAIRPGETVCVVGESGSGKSVTSLALIRLVEFGGGTISNGRLMFDRDGGSMDLSQVDGRSMRRIRGNEIGMIFQEPMTSLNPVLTIGRQLTEGLIAHKGISEKEARQRALSLLQRVRIPDPDKRLDQYPHELSGGMRQRVVIAMALACEPRLLIADEPTTALDVTIQAEILALINRLKRETGTAVLFITHDMAVVAQMADRVVVMYRGKKVEEGPVERIFATPQHEYTQALLAAVPKLGAMRGKARPEAIPISGQFSHSTAVDAEAAPEAEEPAPAPAPDQPKSPELGEVVLDVRHLTTRFPVKGGLLRRTRALVHAVEDVSFDLRAGETLSLVGESGCGKSSTGRSIIQLNKPHSGEIRLQGQDVMAMDGRALREARAKIQMVFQDPFASLNPRMRLIDQVAEPLRNYGLAEGAALEKRVAQLFDRVRLPQNFLRRYPHELSGGQRQRVGIARAIALEPKVIIADEAVSALDVLVQARVLNLLMELQADLGIAMLFISHDMAVVERVSHRAAVMYLGRIVEIGPRAAIFENPQHPYTQALLSAVPIADPARRAFDREVNFKPIPSPVFPLDYEAPPSRYREVGDGHMVLEDA
ncbi:MAG: ABC transporter ATP-binding protein [Pseudomonadota bacterium]